MMMFYFQCRSALILFVLLTCCLAAGCIHSDEAKDSLHEDDHFVSAHWPDDLDDLSEKLRRRVAFLRDPDAIDIDGEHEDGEHEDGEHEDGEHEDGEHEDDEHEDGEHEDGEHEDGEHEDDEHDDDEHDDDEDDEHGHHGHDQRAPAKPLTTESAITQIRDLVGWVSEIAADTSMSEEQWIPLNDASQSLGAELENTAPPKIPETILGKVEKLCDDIDSISQILKDQNSANRNR